MLRVPAARHIRQRCHAPGVPDRRAHEIQVCLQVQDSLLRPANGDGTAAGLRLRRVGTGQSHPAVRAHPADSPGRANFRVPST